jgi:hypothetical protein
MAPPTGVTFVYWADPLFDPANPGSPTDTSFNMVTADGLNAPATWVPFTRAGCNFGTVGAANRAGVTIYPLNTIGLDYDRNSNPGAARDGPSRATMRGNLQGTKPRQPREVSEEPVPPLRRSSLKIETS